MATELNFNQDDEEDQQTQQIGGGPVDSSQGQAVGGGMQRSTMPATRPTTPSGRPNIKQYLEANQGAGQRLAGGIEEKARKQAGEVERGIGEGRTQLEAGSQPLAQNLGEQGSQRIQSAFKDPSSLLQQQDQLSQFQKLRDQGYQQDISNLGQTAAQRQQQLQGQVNQLGQTADLSGSETGRFELLRNTFGQPTYSRGQQRLDQLFLQAQPGAAKTLQQNLQGIRQQQATGLSGLDAETQAKINALQEMSGQRAQEWQSLLTGGVGSGIEEDISQRGLGDIQASSQRRLAEAQAAIAGLPGLQERLKNNQLTNADLDALGLQRGTKLYDVDLSQYITQTPREATLAGTADPTEVARYRALQQLAGDTSGDIFGGATEIGGFKPFDYDKERLQQGISTRQQMYEVDKANQLIDRYVNSMNQYIYGGGSGMRGRRYYIPEQQALIGQLSNIKNQGADFDRWGAIKNLIDPFVQQTGWTGYQDFLTPDYNQVQQMRGRTLAEQQLPVSTETSQIDWDAVADQLANSGYTLPTGKYQEPEVVDDEFFNKK